MSQPAKFIPPPEAPKFYPSVEEFENPLAYIEKIRHIAEKYGICKIIPPASWQPPFAVDVDKLKFTPRVQKLNELEARTRIKLNFLDKIAKFWELEGCSLKIPIVDKHALDLYTLYMLVQKEGGYDTVKEEKKWMNIAACMGFPMMRGFDLSLKSHYEKLLYPFEIFIKGNKENRTSPTTAFSENEATNVKEVVTPTNSKINVHVLKESQNTNNISPKQNTRSLTKRKSLICNKCNSGNNMRKLLACESCSARYHTYCLNPVLLEIPKGNWFCPQCVIAEIVQTTEDFGFEQAQKTYNLHQFGEMADRFKDVYFCKPGNIIPTEIVEAEFWRIVSMIEEGVTVEYGSDLHTRDYGSGFPTKGAEYGKEYVNSAWNLNNMPLLEGSALRFLQSGISGITIPWMYIGMCFSTFCWHNEDHWSYSINYLHWGEPKTWYGVSGMQADLFETVMKSTAPELFQNQPDLLHQLVTMMNPNTLMNSGVNVYRTDQQAGEFVVTFPRAYHAGFNQGYNFAEAVNFAPPDWIKMGRLCVLHYSQLRRFCVFSHDELICKLAKNARALTVKEAAAAYEDMLMMLEIEITLRKKIHESGVVKVQIFHFEAEDDEQRQCHICKTTCYLSAVMCECNSTILLCLKHCEHYCNCSRSKMTLLYKYAMDEFLPLLMNLKKKAESYDDWLTIVNSFLPRKYVDMQEEINQDTSRQLDTNNIPATLTFHDLQMIISQGKEWLKKGFVKEYLINELRHAVRGVLIYRNVLMRIRLDQDEIALFQLDESNDNNAHTNPNVDNIVDDEDINSLSKNVNLSSYNQPINLAEFKILMQAIKKMPYITKERVYLFSILRYAESLEKWIESNTSCYHSDLANFIYECKQDLNNLPGLNQLKKRCEQMQMVSDVHKLSTFKEFIDVDKTKELIAKVKTVLPSIKFDRFDCALIWENRAKDLLEKPELEAAIALLTEAYKLKLCSTTYDLLVDQINKSRELLLSIKEINSLDYYPFLQTVENVIAKSKHILFKFEEVDSIKREVFKAELWLKEAANIFVKSGNVAELFEILSPRNFKLLKEATSNHNLNEKILSNSSIDIQKDSISNNSNLSEYIIDLTTPEKCDLDNIFDENTFDLNAFHEGMEIDTKRSTLSETNVNVLQQNENNDTIFPTIEKININAIQQNESNITVSPTIEKTNLPRSANSCNEDKNTGLKNVYLLNDNSLTSPDEVFTTFHKATQEELSYIKDIRAFNSYCKEPSCKCKKDAIDAMIRCELCKCCFHDICADLKDVYNEANYIVKSSYAKSLCSKCLRSKRPKLHTISNLLSSLTNIKLRLREGEALQFLTERALQWLERADAMLRTEEVAEILKMINQIGEISEEHLQSFKKFSLREETFLLIEELLVEGDLLEVTLEENYTLWLVFCIYRNLKKTDCNRNTKHLNQTNAFKLCKTNCVKKYSNKSKKLKKNSKGHFKKNKHNRTKDKCIDEQVCKDKRDCTISLNNNQRLENGQSECGKDEYDFYSLDDDELLITDKIPDSCSFNDLMMQAGNQNIENGIWRIDNDKLSISGSATLIGNESINNQKTIVANLNDIKVLENVSNTNSNEYSTKDKSTIAANEEKAKKSKNVPEGNWNESKHQNIASTFDNNEYTKRARYNCKSDANSRKDINACNLLCNENLENIDFDNNGNNNLCKSFHSEHLMDANVVDDSFMKEHNYCKEEYKKRFLKKSDDYNLKRKFSKLKKKLKTCKKNNDSGKSRENTPFSSASVSATSIDSLCELNMEFDYGNICAANGDCVSPQGEHLHWVQCDGPCASWFHVVCVGLSIDDIKEDEDYVCKSCRGVNHFEFINIIENKNI